MTDRTSVLVILLVLVVVVLRSMVEPLIGVPARVQRREGGCTQSQHAKHKGLAGGQSYTTQGG